MDGIFCKFVTCCNSVTKQPLQGTIGGPFGDFIPCVAASVAIYVYAGDYLISCVLLLGALLCFLPGGYKQVTVHPTSDPDCSTGDAGDNIVARSSDGFDKSNVDATVCSRVQTGLSLRTRLISAIFGVRGWIDTFSAIFGVRGWIDTFELDVSELEKPIGPVTEYVSWEHLGRPMKQRPKRTCALVACIMAVEAINRFVYELSHGKGTSFPWAAAKPHELLQECQHIGIWNKDTGAYVRRVLDVIRERGGVPLANPSSARTVLPLTGWQDYTGDQLTQELVAELLRNKGPCIGTLWVCPWYHLFDASRNDTWVYRGCGRNPHNRARSKELYKKKVSSHAVLCLGFRRCGEQIHVLVLDNHKTNGPRRWVDAREIDGIYTLTVDCDSSTCN